MAKDNEFIIELLTENGLLSQDQLAEARRFSADSEKKISVIDAVKKLGFVSDADITALLAQQYGMETIDLDHYEIPSEVVSMLSPEVVTTYDVIPVMKNDDVLTVAMSDPTDMETIDSLRYLFGCDIEAVIAPEAQIQRVIERNYRKMSDSVKQFMNELQEEVDYLPEFNDGSDDPSADDDENQVIKLVSLIITEAYKSKASDIHMEPMEKRYRIRYRIDGVLREVEAPPKYFQSNLTSRLKILAHMDITEKRIPLDGRIQTNVGDKDIDLRVSSIPTTHGESIVMRILDKSSIQLDIPKLGFYADDLELVNKIINFPDGIFLVTGPTGSGKTTSLYAFLNTINTVARKIITVEDPVEYLLPGICQVQVDRHVNMTFAAALRSMLRQAPNIIMVGEIRDVETAEIAINAALTGHLVFSTLHTNDAPGAVTRLVDMGVAPFLVASSLRAVMAQRLLRRVCKNCSAPHTPTPIERKMLGLSDEFCEKHQFYKGTGCERCNHTGYKGRIGIYEIFTVSQDIASLIFRNATGAEIRDAARRNGMRTLRDDAMRKAEAGISTLEEVIRVTMMDQE